jgi:hypothetical protein
MNSSIITSKGAQATTLEETLINADLNWEVLSDSVGGMDTGIQMPRAKMIFRSDNNKPLGIVGQDYKPSDPRQFVSSQFEFAEAVGGKVAQVGFIEDRARAFAFVNVGDIVVDRKDAKVGDPMKAYIYSTDGWDGGTPRKSRLYIERLSCLNGQTTKQLTSTFWVSHTKNMDDRLESGFKPFLNEITNTVDEYRNQFKKLADTSMNKEQMEEFLEKLLPGKSTLSQNRRKGVVSLFEGGAGNLGNSRWDAYNAVTEFVTHQRGYRETEVRSASTNRFFGVLETDTLADKALALLNN